MFSDVSAEEWSVGLEMDEPISKWDRLAAAIARILRPAAAEGER